MGAAPGPPPCSVRHVWQRLLSPRLQLSSGLRQVTAGAPASRPSLSKKNETCNSVCCKCFFFFFSGVGGWVGGCLCPSHYSPADGARLPAPSMSAHAPLPCRLDLTAGGDDGENLGSRWRLHPEESERLSSPPAPAGPSLRTPCPDMVVESLLVGVLLGRWGVVLQDERRMISLGRSIVTLLHHTVISI